MGDMQICSLLQLIYIKSVRLFDDLDKVATAVSVDGQSIETVRFLLLTLHGRVQF